MSTAAQSANFLRNCLTSVSLRSSLWRLQEDTRSHEQLERTAGAAPTSTSSYVCTGEGTSKDAKEMGQWSYFNLCFCRVPRGASKWAKDNNISKLWDLLSQCHKTCKRKMFSGGAAVMVCFLVDLSLIL